MSGKREDVRIEEEIDVVVKTIYDKDGILIPIECEYNMKILNISAAGILIASDKEFDDKVSFYFDLELNNQVIKVMPIVVRKFKDPKTKKWNYGCKFLHLETNQEQIIRKYIFERELMKRKGR